MEKIVALAGNPNSGKTTIFNALTGSNQRVGNWPGVTVEKKEGKMVFNGKEVVVVDLPGIYSLSASSIDEKIARDFLLKENPFLVVVVLDASNLERNLYLPVQLMELGVKNTILVFNMMDRVKSKGMEIDVDGLSEFLGVPIIPTVANKGIGIDKLKETIRALLEGRISSRPHLLRYKDRLEAGIEEMEGLLSKDPGVKGLPVRWLAIRLLENDLEYKAFLEKLETRDKILALTNKITREVEEELGYDVETAIIEWRYAFIEGLVKEFVKKKRDVMEMLTLSDKIDRVVTSRFLGLPIFLFILWLIFKFTFDVGGVFSDYIDRLFGLIGERASSFMMAAGLPKILASFVSEGLIGGVGAVLVFLPNIFFLFLAIAVIEESGYMARGAFVMDRIMHALGLHGKSFIPMVLGFGCNVPAIMATRTLDNPKDRIVTILVNPLMSCSARLPIYVLFAGAFFARHQGTVIFSLYLLGIVLAIVMARVFKSVFFKGEPSPLIMELPPYNLPTWRSIFLSAWTRSKVFLTKAGTVILAAACLVWALASLPPGVEYGSAHSYMGRIGSFIAPLFKPAGFGFWQAAVALLFGIVAKEVVVSTLGTLFGAEGGKLTEAISSHFNPVSAYAFMVMSLVYIPCAATIGAIKKETGSWKWTLLAVGYSLVLGWLLSTIVYQVGRIAFSP